MSARQIKKQLAKQEEEALERTDKSMDAKALAEKAAKENKPIRVSYGGFGGFAVVSESDEDSETENQIAEPAKKKRKRNKKKKSKKDKPEEEEEVKKVEKYVSDDEDAFLDALVK